jgi:hypothetical protein
LNDARRVLAGNAPGGRVFELLILSIDVPLDGYVPSLRNAKNLENAYRGDFRRGIFTHDLAQQHLQGLAVLTLNEQAKNQGCCGGSGSESEQSSEAGISGQVRHKRSHRHGQRQTCQNWRDEGKSSPARM